MKTETILILLFVVATAVAIAVQRLAVPYTVALVFTGFVLGLLHAFEPRRLAKALLFSVRLSDGIVGREIKLPTPIMSARHLRRKSDEN
jgi:hypothetical protein